MKHPLTIISLLLFISGAAFSQLPRFSLGTDVRIQHNFTKEQKFWAIGHNTEAQFNLTHTDAAYIGFAYFSGGKFHNDVTAIARSSVTSPQEINYTNNAKMRLKEFSIGWKKYLKGNCLAEKGWNLYGTAGFGLLIGKVTNTHSVSIDTADYDLPVLKGIANFKRLTFDLGLGLEVPIGSDFYFYLEGRTWIPTTEYPSKYIFVNNNAPFPGMLGGGIRLLF